MFVSLKMANHDEINFLIALENLENQEGARKRRKFFKRFDAFELDENQFIKMFRLSKDLTNDLIEYISSFVNEQSRTSSLSVKIKATKKETVKEDLEEADNKVEQSRDVLAIEMFNILSKENEFSEYVLQLLKLQRGYHESALKNLETVIPQLEKIIGNSPVRKVFGTSLKEHLRITGKRIAYPLEICISALSHYGMSEEGLFRIAGSTTKVKRLKMSIDSGCFSVLIPEYRDAHILASLLKLYLRELPEPLLTYLLQKEWINAMHYKGTQRIESIKNIIDKLPQENKDNLAYLIQFLSKLSQHSENKMSASNIAIVLSPNLLWCKDQDETTNMGNCVLINMLVELLITEAELLFPNDMTKHVNLLKLFHDEEAVKANKLISNDLKPDSPKPNTRKKKSAPVPPSSLSIKTDQHVQTESYDISKLNKNLENLIVNSSTDEEYLTKRNSTENINKEAANKNRIQHNEEDIVQFHRLDKKEVPPNNQSIKIQSAHNQNMSVDSINELNSEQIQNKSVGNNSIICSSITIDVHKITDNTDAQLRQKHGVNRPAKPEVPARPLSLTKKSSENTDSAFKKTHCSLYNVANKMQPSIINIQRDNAPPSIKHEVASIKVGPETEAHIIENRCSVNLSCDKTKFKENVNRSESESTQKKLSDKTKSNEQLNYSTCSNLERRNNHTRAKSDGSVTDFEGESTYVSSRNLSKPTQPPPPPPEI